MATTSLNASNRTVFTRSFRPYLRTSAPELAALQSTTPIPKRCIATGAVKMPENLADVSFLGQEQAQQLDRDLMSDSYGFSIETLMELAGLSVAAAVFDHYHPHLHNSVLVLVGPGNNGGDGLVAARHLHHFGYSVEVCYPKRTDKPLFHDLVTQCQSLGISFLQPDDLTPGKLRADIVLDALFGFSFKGPPRAPLDKLLEVILPANNPPALVSVDIPSGWDVEAGDTSGDGIRPDVLVSLTAPKQGVKNFTGVHCLGGRFVPPAIKEKYSLRLPQYPNASQCVRINEK